jgi:hypothetical protein
VRPRHHKNFGVVIGEVILVDSCAVIVIYFVKKKEKQIFCLWWYDTITVQNRFLVELGLSLLFPKGKRCSE